MGLVSRNLLLITLIFLVLFACRADAFGAGNIASISAVEGKNWRHGDIEDVLKTLACIRHHKWNSMMIKRVYFGNWLRDYSQAMDTGALKKAQPETIRILVWLLSFLGFGYATAEFEVTAERLGVYRPEEHIDNPKDYNDNEDARPFDNRLRAPVRDIETQVDQETGMKNYIANGRGDWATSAAYVKYSFERSIHHGRMYTNGSGFFRGKDEDLAEALRCLGQGLHTLEDFGAHTNYVELSLRELGFHNVFPHVGTATGVNLRGKHVFPLVTGTFGMVDFYHSVLGEATDHFTQSEINEMDNALGTAQTAANSSNPLMTLIKLLSKVPGTKELCDEATQLQASSQAQAAANSQGGWGGQRGFDDYGSARASHVGFPGQDYGQNQWNAPQQSWQQQQDWGQSQQFQDQSQFQNFNSQNQFPGAQHQWGQSQQPSSQQFGGGPPLQSKPTQQQSGPPQGLEGMPNFDPAKTVAQIYPILVFRDKVVRTISSIIEKIPGLEALVDRITETLTVFILSLLAPFVRPLINALTKTLQSGSEGVINSSGKHQYEVWTNPHSSDPTHSMLSKDHFSNMLNEPAGNVAAEILKYIVPRVLYAWEHPDVPVQQVMADVDAIFHHPAIRNEHNECHRNMFGAVKRWVDNMPDRGRNLENLLSSEAVRSGKNHKGGVNEHAHIQHHGIPQQHAAQSQGGQHGSFGGISSFLSQNQQQQHQGGNQTSSPFSMVGNLVNNFTGQGGHGGQGHSQSQNHGGSGGQGGFGDVLGLANKLPIPGVQNVTSQFNKYSKFMPGGFGGGRTRGIDDDDGDDPNAFAAGAGSQVGGAQELREAAMQGRSPSPLPMQPPTGYEQYSQSGQDYNQQGSYQYQTQYQDPYQAQGQGQPRFGGASSDYYRS